MASEYKPRGVSGTQGEQLSLTTTVIAAGVPITRDRRPAAAVVLRCPTSDFRYHVNPPIRSFKKDAAGTVTDYTENVRDRTTGTTAVLNSLDTGANSHFIYIGSPSQFAGVRITIGNTNSTSSVLSGKYWKSDGTWAALSLTDGTDVAGATLGQTGNVTWTLPTDWVPTDYQGLNGFFVRLQVATALDSSVTITEAALLNKDTSRGYGYQGVPIVVPLGAESGAIEAILSASTATLDITWHFDGVPVMTGGGVASIDQTAPGTTDRVTVGATAFVTSTPTLSVAGAYATGDYIGPTTTPTSFANAVRTSGGKATIKSITITDKVTTAAVALELWLFSATFTAPTDNAAWAISDAEALTCLGIIPIGTTKWYATSNNKVYSDDTVAMVISPAATSLFYALVARGTTPTWASGDLQISLGILQD